MLVSRRSFAGIATALLLTMTGCARDSGPTLSAPDAYARAQSGELTLIDIRHPDEWLQSGVAKGALRIDMASKQGEAGFVQQVDRRLKGNKHTPIGLLSLSGNRAANAQSILYKAGFTEVYNIREGMMGNSAGPGWIARGLPLEPCKGC